MKKQTYKPKRLLSLLLALVMLLGMVPTTVFASDTDTVTGHHEQILGVNLGDGVAYKKYSGAFDVNDYYNKHYDGFHEARAFKLSVDASYSIGASLPSAGDEIEVDVSFQYQFMPVGKTKDWANLLNFNWVDRIAVKEFNIAGEATNDVYAGQGTKNPGYPIGTNGLIYNYANVDQRVVKSEIIKRKVTVVQKGTEIGVSIPYEFSANIEFENRISNGFKDTQHYVEGWSNDDKNDTSTQHCTGQRVVTGEIWLSLGEVNDPPMTAAKTVKFYADYIAEPVEADIYEIRNLNSNGGDELTVTDPTKSGSVFLGWYEENDAGTGLKDEPYELKSGKMTAAEVAAIPQRLFAKWVPAGTATLTFYGMTQAYATIPITRTVNVGDVFNAQNPEPRDGYYFDGWYESQTGGEPFDFSKRILGSHTFYARFVADEPTTAGGYTVSFVREKGVDGLATNWPSDLSVAAGETQVKLPWTTPQAEGYTFKGWSLISQKTTDGDGVTVIDLDDTTSTTSIYYQPGETITVDGNTTLYAAWEAVEYTVTYETIGGLCAWYNPGLVNPTDVKPGESVSFEVRVKNGFDASTMVVTANGQPLAYKSAEAITAANCTAYTYEFVPTGNTTVAVSTLPSKLQYAVTLPTSEKFNATFIDPDDAAENKSTTVDYGDTVSFKVEAKNENWKVNAVYVNGEKITAAFDGVYTISNIQENKTVTVEMDEVVFYTVHYVIEGAEITASVAAGSKPDLNFEPAVKLGHTFVGWYTDETCKTLANDDNPGAVEQDVYLYGRYQPNSATIKFDLNKPEGCTYNENIVAVMKLYGVATQLPNTKPVDASGKYTFKGWALSKDGDPVYQPGDTFSAEIFKNITLYAVWEINKYQISFNAGPGFTVHLGSSNTMVEHGGSFEFSVLVDEDHMQDTPGVWANWVDADGKDQVALLKATRSETVNDVAGNGKFKKYFYKLENVTADTAVNILADNNETYTVTYYYEGLESDREVKPINGDVYLTQSVGWNETASQPVAPTVEGYAFLGWFVKTAGGGLLDDSSGELIPGAPATTGDYAPFDFATPITADTDIYAMFRILEPTVTFETLGVGGEWEIIDITDGDGNPLTPDANNQFKVPYGTDVAFTLVVEEGFDYSGLALAANGYALTKIGDAVVKDGKTLIPFKLTAVKTNTTITVTGIVRKQITITYYANATDDVAGVPGQQKANYYVAARDDNDTLDASVPSRVGYEFKGWATVPAYWDGTKAVYDVIEDKVKITKDAEEIYQPGDTSIFTSDTSLYAVWAATALTVELDITNNVYDHDNVNYSYEGDKIKLEATLKNGAVDANAYGTFVFYQKARGDETTPTDDGWTSIGESSILSGAKGSIEIDTPEYQTGAYKYWYKVVFQPRDGKGYAACTSDGAKLCVYSKAISWELDGRNAKNELTIYEDNDGAKGGETSSMIANNVYWLEIPTVVELDGVRNLKDGSDELTVGTHYTVTWQYKDSNNDWVTYTTTDTDDVKVEAEYSGYVFRALVYPTESSIYTKAASFGASNDKLVDDEYKDCLTTKETSKVDKKDTETALSIDAPTESKDVTIYGEKPFTEDHLAQYENETVTLRATVSKDDGSEAVDSGYVNFFRRGEDGNVLLNDTPIPVGQNGVATLTVKTTEFDQSIAIGTEANVLEAKDVYFAVYLGNETYKLSTSDDGTVYIKSTQFKTPIVESKYEGIWKDDAGTTKDGGKKHTITTCGYDLTELKAGLTHTFTLRTAYTGEMTDKKYSVVALDGRAVEKSQYTIAWFTLTGDNTEKAIGDEYDITYTTSSNKDGDSYFVRLTAAESGNMRGTVDSRRLIIGQKQDVKVTVEADDAIAATKTGNPDVYQLNEITLRAWVDPAEDDATKLPKEGSGVQFFYMDGDKAVSLGEATLKKDSLQNRMYAELKTSELPVETDGTHRDVTITAVYYGDESFNPSGNSTYDDSTKTWGVEAKADDGVTTAVVTVYSSVVFNCGHENKVTSTTGDFGIHISKKDGSTAAHENGVLELSSIYTLDKGLDEDLRKLVATLDAVGADRDFTIEWQMLKDTDTTAAEYGDADRWQTISGENGTTLVLTNLPQDTAYRAKITVTNTAKVQGSAQEIRQSETDDTINGRKVYYSNVITTGEANSTVSVSLNTSALGENEEGITEGESVTANVFVSGASGKTPEGALSVSITNDSARGNNVSYSKELTSKNTANGWNAFTWDTTGVEPGYYTLTVEFTSNTGYATQTITRSLIVRESSYTLTPSNTTVTYNGQTQGLEVALTDFHFNGTGVDDAASRSWTVKYYDKDNNLVEPVQAGTYTAVITLPASAWWTEVSTQTSFTISRRMVSIEDVVAQAKVYDGNTAANLMEVILKDAETDQNGTGLPTGNTGVLNGDSIYATAVGTLSSADAGKRTLTVNGLILGGDDKDNYYWNGAAYTEELYVSRSQVYGSHADSLKLKQGEAFPAEQVIKMIDQSGREISLGKEKDDYTLTFYYHSDTEIRETATISRIGLYTVIARPNQDNYKGGVTMQFEVVDGETVIGSLSEPKASTLITISDTVDLYGATDGVSASATNSSIVSIEYQNGTTWSQTLPADAGRYLVKVTAKTGDVAYGIYTIVKANPKFTLTATGREYNSMEWNGNPTTTGNIPGEYYVTYAGDVAIGGNIPANGNVDEQAPVDAGTYTVTYHTNETKNYAAHEVSATYTITPKALTVTADSWQTTQYGAFPDFTASYSGLAAETGDNTPDTWTRDVQIAPEFLVNQDKGGFTNDLLDQVGSATVQPVDALAKNYTITYVNGEFTKQREDAQPTLAIHGVQDNNSADITTVYYGDVIQLYPYGTYNRFNNGSSVFTWSVTGASGVSIDQYGILSVNGVGEFTVTLTRGEGNSMLTTTRTFNALKKEVQVVVGEDDKVYNGGEQTYDVNRIDAYDMNWFDVVEYKSELLSYIRGNLSSNKRTDIGTQLVEATDPTMKFYQYRVYGGQFTINDKDATVAPVGDSHTYGDTRTVPTKAYTASDDAAISDVLTASQTDVYNRLDVYDGYEILVAGTENMNYNVKYITDQTAEDSEVTAYAGVKLYSTTTKAKDELNDATVYGDKYNALDWILEDEIDGDTLADFNIADVNGVFIAQDYDNCVDNTVTYKAANRKEGNTDTAALGAPRTATDVNADANYELNFKSVTNTGAANYTLTNNESKNAKGTMTPPTGTTGFIGAGATSDNLIEGSANIAQRPVELSVAGDIKIYWKTPQNQLYQAILGAITATNLAPGHTVEDLDLTLTLVVNGTSYEIDPNSTTALNISSMTSPEQTATVKAAVGDTNYKLTNADGVIGSITLKTIQIEATYTTKTFTNFTVLIKAHADDGTISPLTSAEGLSFKIFKKTGDTVGTTVYASGTLTYTGRTQSDGKHTCGVFTASYPTLPSLGVGETYYIQMYEYGVPLVTTK